MFTTKGKKCYSDRKAHGEAAAIASGLSHDNTGATPFCDFRVRFDDSSISRGTVLILQHLKLQTNARLLLIITEEACVKFI